MRAAQYKVLFFIFFVLLIPIIEQFDGNAAFNWGIFDYLIAFLLLATLGFGLEFIFNRIQNFKIKLILILGLFLFFFLLWAEMAVGIFNSPIAGD